MVGVNLSFDGNFIVSAARDGSVAVNRFKCDVMEDHAKATLSERQSRYTVKGWTVVQ